MDRWERVALSVEDILAVIHNGQEAFLLANRIVALGPIRAAFAATSASRFRPDANVEEQSIHPPGKSRALGTSVVS